MRNKNTKVILGIGAGVIVGVILLLSWQNYKENQSDQSLDDLKEYFDNNTIASSSIQENVPGFNTKAPAVYVVDQQPGRVVVVAQANLDKPAWIAVQDSVNGKPGNVLGARLFDKGNNSGFIELLRATEIGKVYFVVVRSDDGNQKSFDTKKDVPMVNSAGETVMTTFKAIKIID